MARIVGTNGNDSLVGTSSADTIEGFAGNDTLVGLAGNDSLIGGAGNDRYVVATGDVLNDSGGIDTVESSTTWSLGGAFENLVLTGTGVTSGSGNELNNVIIGSAGNNWLRGRGGNDDISGGGGNDTFNMSLGAGGLYGNDTIDGGTGTDTLDFGAAAVSAVFIDLANGSASGGGSGGAGTVSLRNVENANGSVFDDVILGSLGANFLFGFDGHDFLNGGEGADRLEGGSGNDTLQAGHNSSYTDGAIDTLAGGLGDDVYLVGGDGDVNHDIILADPGGNDLVIARTSWTLGAGLENLDLEDFFGSSIDGTGNELDNVIRSGSEGGFLRGMGGNDLLIGREVQNSTHLFGGDGNDTLDPLGYGNLFGEAGDDVLLAQGAASALSGGAGADKFVFGGPGSQYSITDFASGIDKIHLDARSMTTLGASGNFQFNDERFHIGTAAAEADDRVIWDPGMGELWYDADGSGDGAAGLIAWVSGNVVATDIFVDNGTQPQPGGEVINGTANNDSLVGTFGDDTINGFGGNDTLAGSEGADSLIGGDGSDTLDAGINSPWGDEAADTLDGGLGNDVYFVSSDGDVILADPGGIDSVHARNTGWTLGPGLENLFIDDRVGTGFDGVGNELDNHMTGASEGGSLHGMGGNDLLEHFNAQGFTDAHGGEGNDTLNAGQASALFGDAGDDLLIADDFGGRLTGGSGRDTFVFNHTDGVNRIEDFASTVDKIRLDATQMSALGTSGTFSDNDERFHAGSEALESDDRVIWNASTGRLFFDADGSGSGAAQELAELPAGTALIASDIAIINGSAPPPPSGGQTINGSSAPETLTGGAGNDTISGGAGSDRLFGRDGNDRLFGGTEADNMYGENGNDWLDGDAGQDRVTGGAGADSFVYNDPLATGNADYINDFVSGTDKILLDNAVMTALGPDGMLASGRFVAAPNARPGLDSDDRLMYDTVTGKLYYDADGSGAGPQSVIALLTGAPTLAATDILVI